LTANLNSGISAYAATPAIKATPKILTMVFVSAPPVYEENTYKKLFEYKPCPKKRISCGRLALVGWAINEPPLLRYSEV
jgi:hypothetical protein